MRSRNRLSSEGDLFEIILIQIKGGGAKRPDKAEIKRLRDVANYYNARDVVLAEWVKGSHLKFYWLINHRADPKKAWGEVSRFMQGLQQSYTQYFNRKHRKVGHLFQGRYKAIICKKDEYLLTLIRYIHLNPIRAKLVHKPDDYPYSGHREYCGARVREVVEPSRILDMLGGRAGYRKFIQEGIKDGHQEEYYDVIDQRFLGDERFAEKLKVMELGG
jgi:hypothetical protein